jgi:hypothetical protein
MLFHSSTLALSLFCEIPWQYIPVYCTSQTNKKAKHDLPSPYSSEAAVRPGRGSSSSAKSIPDEGFGYDPPGYDGKPQDKPVSFCSSLSWVLKPGLMQLLVLNDYIYLWFWYKYSICVCSSVLAWIYLLGDKHCKPCACSCVGKGPSDVLASNPMH